MLDTDHIPSIAKVKIKLNTERKKTKNNQNYKGNHTDAQIKQMNEVVKSILLKNGNEYSYRTIHGAYSEKDHFHEVEARWMESQDYVYVNRQLQKYCNSRFETLLTGVSK